MAMIMTSLEWPHLATLGTSFEVSDRVDFLTKKLRFHKFLLVEGFENPVETTQHPKISLYKSLVGFRTRSG